MDVMMLYVTAHANMCPVAVKAWLCPLHVRRRDVSAAQHGLLESVMSATV